MYTFPLKLLLSLCDSELVRSKFRATSSVEQLVLRGIFFFRLMSASPIP